MTIGITLGDPAGIGPELVAWALKTQRALDLRVFGDRGVLRAFGIAGDDVRVVEVSVLDGARPGQPTKATGAAQVAYLEAAVAAVRAGEIQALVTAPINKASCRKAGLPK